MTELKHTSLHSEHLALKARMVPFAGWEMVGQVEQVVLRGQVVVSKGKVIGERGRGRVLPQ